MDERIDIVDGHGNPTGETRMKSEAHRLGLLHSTVHVWCYTHDGHILLQQRGKEKETFPLLWDVSVAGHVGAGEGIEISALREIKEEIGVDTTIGKLKKIGIFPSLQKHNETLIDRELHHVFLLKLSIPPAV